MAKLLRIFLLVAFAFGFFSQAADRTSAMQAESKDEVLLANGYRVRFEGVEYHVDGTSTWYYFVEELPGVQDIGNWVLETPFCAPIVGAGPRPWEIVDPDPRAHLSGIKWQMGSGFESGQFWVRLNTAGIAGLTNVAAWGPDMAFGNISGPTCVEGELPVVPVDPVDPVDPVIPVDPVDTEPPSVTWESPVAEGEVYTMQPKQSVDLLVNAVDNVAVARVDFIRWDAINEAYITIAVDDTFPYQATVLGSDINPTWNQVIAISFDAAGNQSEQKLIWLYREAVGPLFETGLTYYYLPVISR